MRAVADLVLKAGEYTTRNGETKGRWVNVGSMMEDDEGGRFLLINPGINFAAYMQPGKDRVSVSIFEKDKRDDPAPF